VDDEKMQLKSSEQVKETEAVRIRKQEEKRLSIVSDLVIKKVWFQKCVITYFLVLQYQIIFG
jgi:hypothetical protein